MNAIAQSLVPVFILILLGYGVRKRGFIDDAFWAPAEKITYYVFFPALLIVSGARADLNGANVGPMVRALFSATLATALLALAMKSRLGLSDSAFTSFFQGSFRPNTYVGVAVAYLLWGDDGLGLIALCILAVVPLANLLAVMVMVRYGEAHEGARTPSRAALEVARNPLVLGCLVGFGLNASGLVLPPLVAVVRYSGPRGVAHRPAGRRRRAGLCASEKNGKRHGHHAQSDRAQAGRAAIAGLGHGRSAWSQRPVV